MNMWRKAGEVISACLLTAGACYLIITWLALALGGQ